MFYLLCLKFYSHQIEQLSLISSSKSSTCLLVYLFYPYPHISSDRSYQKQSNLNQFLPVICLIKKPDLNLSCLTIEQCQSYLQDPRKGCSSYMHMNNIHEIFQSGIRPHYRIETVLIKVVNYLLPAFYQGCVYLLVLLDLGAGMLLLELR